MAKIIVPNSQLTASYYIQHPLDLIKGLSSDIVGFAIIFVALAVYGFYRGKEKLVSLLLALYLGIAVYNSSAFLKSFSPFKTTNFQIFLSKAIVYLIIVVLIHLLLNRIIYPSFTISKMRTWIDVAMLSVAVSFSAIVIAFNSLSLSLAYNSSIISSGILASATMFFWTLVGSLVIIFLAMR